MAIHDDPQKSCPHINEIIKKGRKKAPEKKKKEKSIAAQFQMEGARWLRNPTK